MIESAGPKQPRAQNLKRSAMSREILTEMLALPTAPFAEHFVQDYIERFLRRRKRKGLSLSRDSAGNMVIHVRIGGQRLSHPICFTAHLDHPGFVADRMMRNGRLHAFWRGGVPPEYFPNASVRFYVGGTWIRGRVRTTKTIKDHMRLRVAEVVVDVPCDVPTGTIGMWDFPDPVVRKTRVYARGCDDIAGAAALIGCIDRLLRSKTRAEAYFLFTRAEEVGFVGAIAAARNRTVPRRCLMVVMECSSQLPNARMGDGPILRVGDKTSAFTPAATAFCARVADRLAKRDKTFTYQRKLMDGGTCEASAFCSLGYDATGMCLALGNYHNVNTRRKILGPEYIDLDDFDNAVKWFVALARAREPYPGRDEVLRAKLDEIARTYRKLLRSSVRRPC